MVDARYLQKHVYGIGIGFLEGPSPGNYYDDHHGGVGAVLE